MNVNLEKFLLPSLYTLLNMEYKGTINNALSVSSIKSYHSICPIISIPLMELLLTAIAVRIA